MSPSSTVYGSQHDTKYVVFELLMHAAFVADEIWGFMPEPARSTNILVATFSAACTVDLQRHYFNLLLISLPQLRIKGPASQAHRILLL